MSIGENVRRLRCERDLSQEELAAAIKVHQTHISSIEKNKKSPSLEVLQLLASFFGVSLDALANGEPKHQPEAEMAR